MSRARARDVSALYVHIPFCERKCEYCDFVSVAGARGQHAYAAALLSELRALGEVLEESVIDTVFFGGGTPGLLDLGLMAELSATVRDSFRLSDGAEISLEVNPSSASLSRAEAWHRGGFNRVSVGVQSIHADVLGFLGRIHDGRRALETLAETRAAGFDNVSADLIYAVPGLDDQRWRETLDQVVAARPDHVSCYELTVEDGTPLHRAVAAGTVRVVDADAALRQHRIAVEVLERAGLAQYEVSNFARPGYECRHNLTYWRNRMYAAAGVGAHGHLPAELAPAFGLSPPPGTLSFRYQHGRVVEEYVAARAGSPLTIRDVEWIDEATRAEEAIMLGLRLREGVRIETGAVLAEAQGLAGAGLLLMDGDRAAVTARGEDVLNQVALRLVSAGA